MMNAEEKKAYNAAWYKKNRQHRLVYNKEYYQKNKERLLLCAATWRGKNKERITAYQEKNEDYLRVYNAKYRKKNKKRLAAWRVEYARTLRMQFYDMYGLKKKGHEHGICSCPDCGMDLVDFGTVSHIDGSGAQHRKLINGHDGIRILKDALALYDLTRFAAECFSCNMAAARNGGICPHRRV